jgi:hypothetical protein
MYKGGIMDLFEAIRNRRSCRNYLSEVIDDTVIESILEGVRGHRLHSTLNRGSSSLSLPAMLRKSFFQKLTGAGSGLLKKVAGGGWILIG